MFIGLIQRVCFPFRRVQIELRNLLGQYSLEAEVAQHLSDNHGDRAWTVCEYMEPTGGRWPLYGDRLRPIYHVCLPYGVLYRWLTRTRTIRTPVLNEEVRYAVHNEYALTAADFLARRSRLTFLDAQVALAVLPKVGIMVQELHWSGQRQRQEIVDAERFMRSMGIPLGSRPSLTDHPAVSGKWAWDNWVGGWGPTNPLKMGVKRVKLSRVQFEPGEVAFLKAAWARETDDEVKPDHESARGVVLEKLDVPGLTGSEVD